MKIILAIAVLSIFFIGISIIPTSYAGYDVLVSTDKQSYTSNDPLYVTGKVGWLYPDRTIAIEIIDPNDKVVKTAITQVDGMEEFSYTFNDLRGLYEEGQYSVAASYPGKSNNPFITYAHFQLSVPSNNGKITSSVNTSPNLNTSPNVINSGELKPSKIFALDEPGVVMVVSDIHATVTFPKPIYDSQKMTSVISERINLRLIDPNDKQAIINAILMELASNPLDYLIPSTDSSQKDTHTLAIGSGFIISNDGYIITNAHVAAPSKEELTASLTIANAGLANEVMGSTFNTSSLTDAQKQFLASAVQIYLIKYATMGEIQNDNSMITSSSLANGDYTQKQHAKLVAAGKSTPGKDIAILKVAGVNFPTIPLGDDSQLNVGDKIYVIGYPGAATFNPALNTAKSIQPTFTSGIVSAKKETTGGWTAIQTDATMTHGNSGGPALDESGKVIGIATFGSVDLNTGREIGGLNFIVPTSIIKEFVSQYNAKYGNTDSQNSQTTSTTSNPFHGIPSWVKNNAHYWSIDNIGDDDFVKGIQFLIQQKIITIPSTTQGTSSQTTIPSWIKKDAGWWSEGAMSDDDFIKAIQYLISSGIITP